MGIPASEGRKSNIAVVAVFVGLVLFVAGITAYAATHKGGGGKAKAAVAASVSPTDAGTRFAQAFNSTPPATTQIVGMGECVKGAKDGLYACVYLVQTADGSRTCGAIEFQLSPPKTIKAGKIDNKNCGGQG